MTAVDNEEEEEKDKQSCGALWAGGSSCPAAVLLGSPSVWLAANHGAGKLWHFSSVCQSEREKGGGGERNDQKMRGGSKRKEQLGEREKRGGGEKRRERQTSMPVDAIAYSVA